MILVLVNLDPHNAQEATYELPLWEWKLPDHGSLLVEDLMRDQSFVLDRQGSAHPARSRRHAVRALSDCAARSGHMNAPQVRNALVNEQTIRSGTRTRSSISFM